MLPAPITLKLSQTSTHYAFTNIFRPKPHDFYLHFNDKIIPVVRSKMADCQLLDEQCPAQQRVICITENLEPIMFNKFIELLHGSVLKLTTMKELSALIDIADYMKSPTILQQIQTQIQRDIQRYEVFCLLELAYKYGLQRIFTLCIQYLEVDQFEQIKYNKFDFLECSFQLFQIVLRRHHIMKLQGKIKGLLVTDILQIIKTYCHRKQIDEHTTNRLIEKYVKSIQNVNFHKNSLRLDKLMGVKQIMQSANIETDYGENQNLNADEVKDNNYFISSFRYNRGSKQGRTGNRGKHSYSVKKDYNRLNIGSLHDVSLDFKNQEQEVEEVDSFDMKDKEEEFKININVIDFPVKQDSPLSYKHTKVAEQKTPTFQDNNQLLNFKPDGDQQPQHLVSRISMLLGEYEEAIRQYSDNFDTIRRNSNSNLSAVPL